MLNVSTASFSNLNGTDACLHALGVRMNVAVRTRSCTKPNVTNVDPVANPNRAIGYAERLAKAMLTRVTVVLAVAGQLADFALSVSRPSARAGSYASGTPCHSARSSLLVDQR
jgi:hypothetical protein